MSRCFPFPPPGYEKKARGDDVELLTKEKHKEKKHKKEKRDKEKREGKERKDKDKNKEKHKDKKKEKHKDKKKDKDREKDKTKTTDEKGSDEGHLFCVGESSRERDKQALKNKDFEQEFIRRISAEAGDAKNRIPEKFNGTILQRGIQDTGRVASDVEKKFDGKEKTRDKENDDRKKERRKDRDRDEKRSKDADKAKEKEKEKDKVKERSEHKHRDQERESHKGVHKHKQQVAETHKSEHIDSCGIYSVHPQENLRKRKDSETNGVLHDNDIRPNKLPRLASSTHLHMENGRKAEQCHIANPCFYDKQGITVDNSNKKLERTTFGGTVCLTPQSNKDQNHRINGKIEAQLPLVNHSRPEKSGKKVEVEMEARPPLADHSRPEKGGNKVEVEMEARPPLTDHSRPEKTRPPLSDHSRPEKSGKKVEVEEASRRPPHPDTQFLNLIYTVPEMAEWSKFDNQEWLFSSDDLQTKPKIVAEAPQVWAESVHIESADVHALPYVIPY
ncbi:hypothetical protein AMTRI_Chr06g172750 [Amborella trichopoda]